MSTAFPAHIVPLHVYSEEEHGTFNLKKFAQLKPITLAFEKQLKIAHWVFYAEFAPPYDLPEGDLIEVTSEGVTEGWLYNPTTSEFIEPVSGWKSLLTDEELRILLRYDRNKLIAGTDWAVIRHRDQLGASATPSLTEQQYQAVLSYRQALRDFPAVCDPRAPVWPTPPSFL